MSSQPGGQFPFDDEIPAGAGIPCLGGQSYAVAPIMPISVVHPEAFQDPRGGSLDARDAGLGLLGGVEVQ